MNRMVTIIDEKQVATNNLVTFRYTMLISCNIRGRFKFISKHD